MTTALEARQSAAHVVDAATREQRAVFLIDGLDEAGDEAGRKRAVDAVETLRKRAPGCLIVVTSRISGYSDARLPALHVMVAPFNKDAIRRFLIRWCERYEIERTGAAAWAAARGRAEGATLANDILDNKSVARLAGNPLMLAIQRIQHLHRRICRSDVLALVRVRCPYTHPEHAFQRRWQF
jgi:predicted NACHT family NTPase